MAGGLSIFHFIDRCGGLDGFLAVMRSLERGEPMYRVARASGIDPGYMSKFFSEHAEKRWLFKPDLQEVVQILINEQGEAINERTGIQARILKFAAAGKTAAEKVGD